MERAKEVTITNDCLIICPTYRHRLRYRYDTGLVSYATGLKCEDVSRAVQSQKEEADINTIVRRFGLTGQLPSNVRMPQYGDFTAVGTYQEALNAVIEAENSFNAMPADVRERFGNDPAKFVDFCMDEKNREEAEKLGLVVKKETVAKGVVPTTDAAVKPEQPKGETKGTTTT